MPKNPVCLLILDGWGHDNSWGGNAITIAQTPNFNKITREFPNTLIQASGQYVGLPGHEVGNSEVGHMNLGAGNIVLQDVSEINKSIQDGSFYNNQVLREVISNSKKNGTALHLMGIVSDGGIHSHIVHLLALIKLCSSIAHRNVYIHAFTDGRDSEPMKGLEFINILSTACESLKTGTIATVLGRGFLDRKGDWQKTKIAYDAIVNGVGQKEKSALSGISSAYRRGETDEFISPIIMDMANSRVKNNDAVIFFNFRSDRTRQLTKAFLDPNFSAFKRPALLNLDFVTFIPYGAELELGIKTRSPFKKVSIARTIGKYFQDRNLKQFHIAETEKYAHVTYFINGNLETPYNGEDRVIIPSPNVRSYAEKPEMSGEEVKDNLISQLKRSEHSLYICNFANPDMVGHTGDFKAAVATVEFLDKKIKEIVDVCVDESIPILITADHGNIERMVDPITGKPHTEHTKNKVPVVAITVRKDFSLLEDGRLGNIASTLIEMANLEPDNLFLPGLIQKSKTD